MRARFVLYVTCVAVMAMTLSNFAWANEDENGWEWRGVVGKDSNPVQVSVKVKGGEKPWLVSKVRIGGNEVRLRFDQKRIEGEKGWEWANDEAVFFSSKRDSKGKVKSVGPGEWWWLKEWLWGNYEEKQLRKGKKGEGARRGECEHHEERCRRLKERQREQAREDHGGRRGRAHGVFENVMREGHWLTSKFRDEVDKKRHALRKREILKRMKRANKFWWQDGSGSEGIQRAGRAEKWRDETEKAGISVAAEAPAARETEKVVVKAKKIEKPMKVAAVKVKAAKQVKANQKKLKNEKEMNNLLRRIQDYQAVISVNQKEIEANAEKIAGDGAKLAEQVLIDRIEKLYREGLIFEEIAAKKIRLLEEQRLEKDETFTELNEKLKDNVAQLMSENKKLANELQKLINRKNRIKKELDKK